MAWEIAEAQGYGTRFKQYRKNFEAATVAVYVNLETYFQMLQRGIKPLQIKAGFIHPEPGGVIALDQTGAGKRNLHETRLYVFPEIATETLWLITIGDKESQGRRDLKDCREFIKRLN